MRNVRLLLPVLVLVLIAPDALGTAGGPDGYGHYWNDVAAFTWIDASGGSDTGINADDGWFPIGTFPIGFDFQWYGVMYTGIKVTPNGGIKFTNDISYFSVWTCSAYTSYYDSFIMLGGDRAIFSSDGAWVRYLTSGTAPNRTCAIEFHNIRRIYSDPELFDLEIVLNENGGMGEDAVVAIQNAGAVADFTSYLGGCDGVSDYIQYLSNCPNTFANNLAVTFSTDVPIPMLDFGDAPDPTYPTLLTSNGAHHWANLSAHLGTLVDAEFDGQPSSYANGDDLDNNDDEDGVTFDPIFAGPINSYVTASNSGWLDVWLDSNQDGTWAHPGERVFSAAIAAGTTTVPLNLTGIPAGSWIYARYRYNHTPGIALTPYGGPLTMPPPTLDGEVEDYALYLWDHSGEDCSTARVVDLSSWSSGSGVTYSVSDTTEGASDDIDESVAVDCWPLSDGPEHVYEMIVPVGGLNLQIDLLGSDYDTMMAIVQPCPSGSTFCIFNDDYPPVWQSGFNCRTFDQGTYNIIISGYGGLTGNYTLNITECWAPPPIPTTGIAGFLILVGLFSLALLAAPLARKV